MKACWIVLLSLCLPLYAAQESRTWTSASGKTIEATFVELKYGQVILQPPAGETIKISLDKLSSTDQIYVGSQSKPAGTTSATLAYPAEKTIPP